MVIIVLLFGLGIWWFFGKTEKAIGNSDLDDKTKTTIMIIIAVVFILAWSLMDVL